VQCTRQPPPLLLGQQKDQRGRQFLLQHRPTTAQEGKEGHKRKPNSRKDNCAIMCWCQAQSMTMTTEGEK
jgi:hypothetical protein